MPQGSIHDWDIRRKKFENRFKKVEDDSSLVSQLGSMKKGVHEPMRDFMTKFNKLCQKISKNIRPRVELLKSMCINTLP